MSCTPRPWTTAGVALVGASLIAVTPVAAPPPGVAHRPVQLTSYDGWDLSWLISSLEAHFPGLESALGGSNWLTDPDISQGLMTLSGDLVRGTANPVTNPFALFIEGGLLLSSAANGAPTDTAEALQLVSNTVADEAANVGGANSMTGSLPLVTGNLDLSVNLDQLLSDLGVTSNGAPLTVDGLLTDLHISPTANVLPPLTIGDVLGYFHLTDSSGITLGQALGDLGLTSQSGITLGQVLSDLGLTDNSSITLGQVLSALGVSDSSGITVGTILGDLGLTSKSGITLGQVLGDLGLTSKSGITLGQVLSDLSLSDSSTITPPSLSIPVSTILGDLGIKSTSGDLTLSVPSLSVSTVLSDLGINPNSDLTFSVPGVSLGTILGDLGINTNSGLNAANLIIDLVGNPSVQAGCISFFGGSQCIDISLSQLLGDAGLNNDTISLSSILSHLGINTGATFTPASLSVPVSTILSDLGINTNGTISVPSLSVPISTILGDLGVSSTSGDLTLSVPSLTLGTVLSDLGLSDSTALNLSDVLSALGLSDSSSIGIGEVLSALGLSDNSSITLGEVLNALGLSDDSSITLGEVLSALGLSDNSGITLGQVLSALGLSDNSSIGIGQVLSALSLSDNSVIPLPSLSIDKILTGLGINPDADIFNLLGISNPLSLSHTIDVTGGPVPTFDLALAQDLMATLGNIPQLAQDLPSLLTNDPTLDVVPLLHNLMPELGLPVAITGGTLTADLTNIAAELLAGLVP